MRASQTGHLLFRIESSIVFSPSRSNNCPSRGVIQASTNAATIGASWLVRRVRKLPTRNDRRRIACGPPEKLWAVMKCASPGSIRQAGAPAAHFGFRESTVARPKRAPTSGAPDGPFQSFLKQTSNLPKVAALRLAKWKPEAAIVECTRLFSSFILAVHRPRRHCRQEPRAPRCSRTHESTASRAGG